MLIKNQDIFLKQHGKRIVTEDLSKVSSSVQNFIYHIKREFSSNLHPIKNALIGICESELIIIDLDDTSKDKRGKRWIHSTEIYFN
jgi:hypothetical protein